MHHYCSTLISLLCLSLLGSCGTPQLTFFAPPQRNTIDTGTIAFFHNTANSSDQFLGYNIYYKFYDNSDSATITCVADKQFINTEPTLLNDNRLIARRYSRIFLNDADNIPTIQISAKTTRTEFRIELANPLARIAENREVSLVRNLTNNSQQRIYRSARATTIGSEYKPLHFDNSTTIFSATDSDIQQIITTDLNSALNEEQLYIAFYGIAIGLNDAFARIYSEPEFLGYLALNIEPSSVHPCNS